MDTLLFESFFFNRIFIRFHLISFTKFIIYFNDYAKFMKNVATRSLNLT